MESDKGNKKIDAPVFATLVHSIVHSALAAMGLIPELKDKKDKNLAEFNIELLRLLKEKTKNNLTTEESELLDNALSDLQITFTENIN